MSLELNTVVFVCTGNVCRSPMAERLLAHALDAEPEPLKSIQVRSAGVAAYPGDPASENSVVALKKVGIPLEDFRSSPLSDQLIDEALVIFGMTESHKAALTQALANVPDAPPVMLMRELIPDVNDESAQIPDPFGGPLPLYEASRDSMVEAIPSIIDYLRRKT